ncbi:COP9 signalosome complex subunit 12 [Sarcoptes scabiei]|nr:COP9 signalosome complex subunit 12 [Sarcoptes scabiei]
MEIPNPPEDLELRNIIDKLAQFVARNGPSFEMMTKNKQQNNPKFMFLFGGEYNAYYQHRVSTEKAILAQDSGNYGLSVHPPLPPNIGIPNMNSSQNSMGPGPPSNNFFMSPLPQQQPQHFVPTPPSLPNQSQFGPNIPITMNNFGQSLPPPPLPPPPHRLPGPASFTDDPSNPHSLHGPSQFMSPRLPLPMNFANHGPPPLPQSNWPVHSQPTPATNPMNNKEQFERHQQQQTEIDSQITQFQDHLKQSEKNLAAQYDVIMGSELNQSIENLLTKLLDDELKRMCEDYSINLNEFDKILQPIIESCRKESIANGKIWIFNNCKQQEHYDAVGKHLLKKVSRTDLNFEAKLHLMYLVNDIFNHCMRKNDEQLKSSIMSIIIPAFSAVINEANEERKLKMNKLLKIWESNQYIDQTVLDKLRKPQQSFDEYKTSLRKIFADQIKSLESEQSKKYEAIEKQHQDFVMHCNAKIKELNEQKHSMSLPSVPMQSLPPQPIHSTLNASFPPPPIAGQVNGNLSNGPPPFVHHSNGTQNFSYPPSTQHMPPFLNNNLRPMPMGLPPQQQPMHVPGPPRPLFNEAFPTNNFFSPSNNGNSNPMFPASNQPPRLEPPAINMPLPHQIIPPSGPHLGLPLHPPPHIMSNQSEDLHSMNQKQAYFDSPAGIMTQLIKLEDFEYNPIDPKDIKMPPLVPPSERLLQALEAFYSPASHEHPRNADGWEKLGLYEFFKAKSQAKKECESKNGTLSSGGKSNSKSNQYDSDDRKNSNEAKKYESDKYDDIGISPRRHFKEFKENKRFSK